MAAFNQVPTAQGSIAVSLDPISVSTAGTVTLVVVNTTFVNPVSIEYTIQSSTTSLNLNVGQSSGQTLPTTGQIWPSGYS